MPRDAIQHGGDSVTLSFTDFALIDTFQLFHSPTVPATLSIVATWSSKGTRIRLNETSLGSRFIFDGVDSTIDVQWSAASQVSLTDSTRFAFQSSGATTSLFARLGHERNGSFAH